MSEIVLNIVNTHAEFWQAIKSVNSIQLLSESASTDSKNFLKTSCDSTGMSKRLL
jgi:hypothetical protein